MFCHFIRTAPAGQAFLVHVTVVATQCCHRLDQTMTLIAFSLARALSFLPVSVCNIDELYIFCAGLPLVQFQSVNVTVLFCSCTYVFTVLSKRRFCEQVYINIYIERHIHMYIINCLFMKCVLPILTAKNTMGYKMAITRSMWEHWTPFPAQQVPCAFVSYSWLLWSKLKCVVCITCGQQWWKPVTHHVA